MLEQVLERVAEDVWVVEGPNVPFLGLSFGTRMTIIRLANDLWVHSPVAIAGSMQDQIAALGHVRYVVSPNKYHHVFLTEWRDKYPEAQLYASPGLSEKRPDVAFDSELTPMTEYPWSDTIAQEVFGPSRLFDEVVFFHRPSRTLVLTDLIVNLKTDGFNRWQKLFAAFDGLGYPNGTTPRLYRWSMKSKTHARSIYRTMLEWNPARVIISHGEWFREAGRKQIESRLAWIV